MFFSTLSQALLLLTVHYSTHARTHTHTHTLGHTFTQEGYGVLVLNPNRNHEEKNGKKKPIKVSYIHTPTHHRVITVCTVNFPGMRV